MEPKYPEIIVKLTGQDGNAFAIIGKVRRALKQAGVDPTDYMDAAMSGNYDELLVATMKWVTVE